MRLWHQSLVDLSTAPEYVEALREHAQRVSNPGTIVDLHGVASGLYGDASPAEVAGHVYLSELVKISLLDNVRHAESEGYDAYAIVTLQDPSLREARSLVDIPVIGYGESAMLLACMLGDKFGVVAFNAPLFPLFESQMRAYGLHTRAAPIVEARITYDDVKRGLGEPAAVVAEFERAARVSLSQGADVIIPGQAILGVLLAKWGVTRVDGAPVIDPLGASVKFAETLVELQRLTGVGVSRRGYYYEKPQSALATRLRESL